MGDNLSILLLAELDKATSTTNINNQIKQLNGNLAKLNVKINFDDSILKNLNDQIKEITKDLAKSNNATVKIDTTELEKAKKMFKDVEGELISFKEKVSFDKEGNKITRLISQFKMLDGTIKTVTKNASGRILGETYSKDLQKAQNEREKALQQEEKIRLKLAQQEEKIRQKRAQEEQKLAEQQMKNQSQLSSQQQKTLAQMQKQYQTTLNLFNSLKNDSRNLFKADGKNSLESYINQLANIKSQLSDMQKGKLSIADSKTTQEMQKQLNIMEQEFNRQKSLIALDEQKEKVQRRINDLLRQIESVRLKTTDEGQLAQLSQLENSIKNIKLTSTDATVQLDRFQAELKEIKFDGSKTKALEDLMFRIEEFKSTTNSKLQKLFDTGKIDSSQLENFKNKLNEISTNSPNAEKQMVRLRNEINNVARNANTGATGIQKFVKTVLQLAGIGSMYMVMQKMVNVTKELTLNVMELDSAMISLQRVSSGTATTYEDFKNNMFGIADAVGSTATDMIRSAKEFAQLGYSLEEAGILAENASKLATAGEMSIDQATKNITASLTAFNMEIEESGRLIDVYNRIGNTMAITSEGIGVGLARSANALAQANNTLEESVALISATNKTLQNPEVAGRGWRTISMRIRGVAEDGEELDSKLGEIIEKYTGVKIFDEATQEFKSTYQIVLELSKVWDTLTDAQRAFLAEKIAGKNQAEVLLPALTNAEDLVRGLEEAQNALGTTEEEMALVMGSWEAKVNQLKNAWLEFGQTLINSDFVKGLVDGLTKLVQKMTELIPIIEKLMPLIKTIGVTLIALKLSSLSASLVGIGTKIIGITKNLASLRNTLTLSTVAAKGLSSVLALISAHPVIVGLTLLTATLTYFSSKAKQAKEDAKRLREELLQNERELIQNTQQEISSGEDLQKSYKEITESTMTRSEKVKELAKLQMQLYNNYGNEVEGIDLVNKSYEENIQIMDKAIEKKKEYYLDMLKEHSDNLLGSKINATSLMNDEGEVELFKFTDEQEEDLKKITDQLSNIYEKSSLLKTETKGLFENGFSFSFQGDLNESLDQMKLMQQMLKGTSLEGTDFYNSLTDSIKRTDDLVTEYNETQASQLQVQSEIISSEAMRVASIEDVNNATDEQLDRCANYIESLSDVDEEVKKLAMSLLGIDTSANGDGIDSVIQKLNGLKKTSEQCQEDVANIETAMADLTGILEDLDAGNGITSGSLKKIISDYPDLLQYMNNEGELREKLQEKMEEYTSQYKDSMRDWISTTTNAYDEANANSVEYYNNQIRNNEQTYNTLTAKINDFFTAVGLQYKGNLKDYTTLEQAKARITEELINGLGQSWKKYFNSFGKLKTGFSLTDFKKNSRESYAKTSQGKLGLGKSLSDKTLDTLYNATVGKEVSEAEEQMKNYFNIMNKFSDMMNSYSFEPVSIKVGGSKSAGGGSSGGSKSSSSEKYASYVDSLYSSIIEAYESGSEKLAQEIEVASKRVENAQTKNGLGLDENALIDGSFSIDKVFENASKMFESDSDFSILEQKYLDASKAIAKHSENLRNLRKQIVSELSAKNYTELKGVDLNSINQFQLDKIVKKLETQIDKADTAGNNKLKASLEYKKDLIEDYAGNIIDINQKVNELASDYQDAMSDYANAVIDHINKVYDGVDSIIDRQMTQLSTMQDYLRDSDSEGWFNNQSQQIDLIVAKEQSQLKRIQEYKKQGYDEDSELMQQAYDTYYSYYQERLALVKEEGEKRIEYERQAQEKIKDQLTKDQEDINDLLDKTLEMLKQNINDQIDALEERKNATLENLKEEKEAYEEAIDKEIDMYRKLIEAKKEALNQEYDEYTYNKDVEEATKEIAVLENKIEALSKDSSAKAQAQVAQYKEQLEKAREALYELQYKHSIEEQEKALDEELDKYETLKESEKEAHEDYLDEKYEATEKEFDEEIDALKRQLEEEGRLRQQAIKLIESKSQDFYDQLMEWNDVYGTGIREDVTRAWDNCYSALENYNNGQLNVSNTLDTIISQLEQCESLIDSLGNAEWQDYVNSDMMNQDYGSSDYEDGTSPSSSSSSSSSSNSKTKAEEQLNEQAYLHDLMVKAKAENNQGLISFVKAQRRKYGLDPDTGAIVDQWHTGIEKGRVGDGLKPDEIIAKLTKDEFVFTGKQMQNLADNAKTLVSNNTQQPQLTLQIDKVMEVGTIEKGVDVDSLLNKVGDGIADIVAKKLGRSFNMKFGW